MFHKAAHDYRQKNIELIDELDELNKGGAFIDIELDAAAMQALSSQGGA